MKIKIGADEWYPVAIMDGHGPLYDIPADLIARHDRLSREFGDVNDEVISMMVDQDKVRCR